MTIINNGISNSIVLLTQEPLSDRIKTASLNTLLGMGMVFAVLILMILLISLFKFLPGSTPKANNNEPNTKVSPVDNVIAHIVSQEEANLINDYELVAVITAAISEFNSVNLSDAQVGGFVVRSIRKVNRKKYI